MAEPVGRTDRVEAYAEAVFNIAQAEGDSAELEDELFRFARILEGSEELREKLSDPHIPVTLRQQIVEDLLGGKARPATTNIVSMLVGNGRVRELPGIVTSMTELSASRADKEVAEVHSAIPLSEDQVTRLAEALRKSTGKHVDVRVVIDESVKGGLVARVGDTVIDGSVRRRLEQLRNAL
jgi:F-type H+-transporting ATPase subunit delta